MVDTPCPIHFMRPTTYETGFLSPWHRCLFESLSAHDPKGFSVCGKFPTPEHWLAAEKVKFYGDVPLSQVICATQVPREARDLSLPIGAHDPDAWSKISFQSMTEGYMHKFIQHKDFLFKLFATGLSDLVHTDAVVDTKNPGLTKDGCTNWGKALCAARLMLVSYYCAPGYFDVGLPPPSYELHLMKPMTSPITLPEYEAFRSKMRKMRDDLSACVRTPPQKAATIGRSPVVPNNTMPPSVAVPPAPPPPPQYITTLTSLADENKVDLSLMLKANPRFTATMPLPPGALIRVPVVTRLDSDDEDLSSDMEDNDYDDDDYYGSGNLVDELLSDGEKPITKKPETIPSTFQPPSSRPPPPQPNPAAVEVPEGMIILTDANGNQYLARPLPKATTAAAPLQPPPQATYVTNPTTSTALPEIPKSIKYAPPPGALPPPAPTTVTYTITTTAPPGSGLPPPNQLLSMMVPPGMGPTTNNNMSHQQVTYTITNPTQSTTTSSPFVPPGMGPGFMRQPQQQMMHVAGSPNPLPPYMPTQPNLPPGMGQSTMMGGGGPSYGFVPPGMGGTHSTFQSFPPPMMHHGPMVPPGMGGPAGGTNSSVGGQGGSGGSGGLSGPPPGYVPNSLGWS
eukprot:PhF_6_TR42953/c0_g1_i2/m.65332